jgi:leucyl/phenylalanyl-tRNA--protein transferase
VDTAFDQVIRACADREETWISEEIVQVYCGLFGAGYGHSVEAWEGGTLVGGLYGVAIGGALLAAGAHAVRRTVLKKPEEEEGFVEESTQEGK